MEKKERGALTVEAITVLMIFLFGMLALLNITNMVRTQVVIQNSLNQTAKEISQYSYILYRLGYLDYLAPMTANEESFQETIDKYTHPGSASDVYENLSGLMKQFSNDGGSAAMDGMIRGLFAMASNAATNWIHDYICTQLARESMDQYMESMGGGSDMLQRMGIVNGEIQYYCTIKDKKIMITAEYKMKYTFPFLDLSFEKPIRLSAVTAAWAGGVKK